MKIVGLNLDIAWENSIGNFRKIEENFSEYSADIFMLPEMFSTGFSMNAEHIADKNNNTLNWMKSFAEKKNSAVCGSVSVQEDGKFYNRFYFVEPNGNHHQYNKKHLFSYSGEDKVYTSGNERTIVIFKNFRILLQVCYDLRFPVFARNDDDYDAVFYLANWPETRIDAWKTLLKARAIENQSYIFGLNRIGIDGNNLAYPESSYCFFADGSLISKVEDNLVIAHLDLEKLHEYRETFPFLKDRDHFELK